MNKEKTGLSRSKKKNTKHRVRCSWETTDKLENGAFKDFGHMKLYCTHLSPKEVEKLLNAG
jgi:hypothetical protein